MIAIVVNHQSYWQNVHLQLLYLGYRSCKQTLAIEVEVDSS